MPVPATLADIDPVASNNSPSGTEPADTNVDNYMRAAFAFISQLANGSHLEINVTPSGSYNECTVEIAPGVFLKFGSATSANGSAGNVWINFVSNFPTGCLAAWAMPIHTGTQMLTANLYSKSSSSVRFTVGDTAPLLGYSVHWFAIGY